ncbi:MAG: ATP-binding protein [Candidatus Saccharibacteria bacterium]|nr:ATP-binding protein [Candidatus Saccharibacteria bacterium]
MLTKRDKLVSSFRQIPIRSIKHGVLETKDDYLLILRIQPLNFELFSFARQDVLLSLYQKWLTGLTNKIQILIQIRELDQKNGFQSLKNADNLPSLLKDWQIFSRNFYIILSQPKTASVTEVETINQLHLQVNLLTKGLSNLNLVSQILDTDEVLHLLFDSYHAPRKTTLSQFLKIRADQSFNKLLSFIGYKALEENIHHLRLNGGYVRTLSIADYPAKLTANCLNSLIQANLNLDLSYQIQPLDSQLALYRLTRKITEMESSKRIQLKSGRLIDETLTSPLDSALSLRSKLQKRQESLLELALYISIYADSEAELDQVTATVQNILRTNLFAGQVNSYQQLPAWQACLPYQRDELKVTRNLDSSSLALTFPFANTEIIHPDGILYGINQNHHSLVIVDRFSLPNANSVILAQSGAGKSYCMKVEILRQFNHGVQIFILDPENEYRFLVTALRGRSLDITKSDQVAINFLDISLNQGLDLSEHIAQVIQILSVMLEGLEKDDKAVLDEALLKLYEDNDQPLLIDLYKLVKSKSSGLSLRLKRFTTGSLASIFNVSTKLATNNRLISFNLQNISVELKPSLMLILTYFISNQIKYNLQKRLLVIDEAWSLVADDLCGQSINSLVRRARKYYLGVCLISQQASDFLNSNYGQALIAQSSLKILLKQDAITIDEVTDQFYLSEYEKHFLLTCSVGQALIIADQQHATVKIIASNQEHPVITTKPQDGESHA